MKAIEILSLLLLTVSLITCTAFFVKEWLTPKPERKKGLYVEITSSIVPAAVNAKAWLYSFMARWHIDSYTISTRVS